MKNKPIVMEHYHKVHTTYVVDFTFTTNITFLTGDSGQGRSVVFSFLEEDAVKNSQLLCFNYLDWQKDIKSLITGAEGKLIVVDNADLLLTDVIRINIYSLAVTPEIFMLQRTIYLDLLARRRVKRRSLRLKCLYSRELWIAVIQEDIEPVN